MLLKKEVECYGEIQVFWLISAPTHLSNLMLIKESAEIQGLTVLSHIHYGKGIRTPAQCSAF